jgi:hypothetical protein
MADAGGDAPQPPSPLSEVLESVRLSIDVTVGTTRKDANKKDVPHRLVVD